MDLYGLKPCPFCGQEDVELMSFYPQGYSIMCMFCEVRQPFYSSMEDAVEGWNERLGKKEVESITINITL